MGQKLYGNNRIFCKGRFISGPDVRSSIASLLMILVPSIIWHLDVGIFYAERYSVVIPLFAVPVQIASIVLLLATALSDPGIMPKQKGIQEHYDEPTKSFRTRQPPRYYDLLLRGHPFKLKYCITCNIYRPPRCTHCSVCENCIERFDHHCPWIGNCIGKRNYWLFYFFVSFTAMLNVFTLATSVSEVVLLTQEISDEEQLGAGDALFGAIKEAPIAAALSLYSAAIVWFTVGLFAYHNYLICTNQTTYEQIKGAYSSGNNPFHRGVLGNCEDILFSSVRRRYFDASVPNGRMLWPTAEDYNSKSKLMTEQPKKMAPVDPSAQIQQPPPALQAQEKRKDPNDNSWYTYGELMQNYSNQYDQEQIDAHWDRMKDNSEAGIEGINLQPGPRVGQAPPSH